MLKLNEKATKKLDALNGWVQSACYDVASEVGEDPDEIFNDAYSVADLIADRIDDALVESGYKHKDEDFEKVFASAVDYVCGRYFNHLSNLAHILKNVG